MSDQNNLTVSRNDSADVPAAGSSPTSRASQGERAAAAPVVEIIEDGIGITLLADMPGVSREKLDVRLDGETLVIEGDTAVEGPEGMRGLWAEVHVPRYRRSFTLSRELDTSRIEAGIKDGVLTLRIPKQTHVQPRRIAVSLG
ncbi:Hsp20/alpha crystallin family protein [Roseateles chitosanitabidus]|uniref:Hsp20/alpha crystallin family protein n=1 Tax=Roseateles chitosanitabidus TaxID=65048 RepID=UPI000A01B5D1|nr:Hsp20/alpha crystallin family protein [Roseateles chitosanitabidus]